MLQMPNLDEDTVLTAVCLYMSRQKLWIAVFFFRSKTRLDSIVQASGTLKSLSNAKIMGLQHQVRPNKFLHTAFNYNANMYIMTALITYRAHNVCAVGAPSSYTMRAPVKSLIHSLASIGY